MKTYVAGGFDDDDPPDDPLAGMLASRCLDQMAEKDMPPDHSHMDWILEEIENLRKSIHQNMVEMEESFERIEEIFERIIDRREREAAGT